MIFRAERSPKCKLSILENHSGINGTFMPQVFNIPKVEHDQPCSTLVVIVFQISLFIYVILGPDWSMAKVKVNKQTNLQKQ